MEKKKKKERKKKKKVDGAGRTHRSAWILFRICRFGLLEEQSCGVDWRGSEYKFCLNRDQHVWLWCLTGHRRARAGQWTKRGGESEYSTCLEAVVWSGRLYLEFWQTTLVWVRHEAVLLYSPGLGQLGFHPASHTTYPSKYVRAVHAVENLLIAT